MVSLSVAATAGDYDNLRKWAEALATLAETYNFPPQRAVASFFLEWGRAQTGELDLAKLRSTFNAVVAIGPLTLVYVALHAEELHKAGHDEEALSVADHFVGALKFPFGFYLPEVLRVRGECLAALGGEEDAMEQLQHAAELALDQGSQLFALRAAIARARSCSKHDAKYSAMADVERSLAAIGTSGWPEIAAAREMPVH